MEQGFERYLPDLDAYHRRARGGPCFVCAIVAGDPEFSGHPVVYEDELAITFLTKTPPSTATRWCAPRSTASRRRATSPWKSTSTFSGSFIG